MILRAFYYKYEGSCAYGEVVVVWMVNAVTL